MIYLYCIEFTNGWTKIGVTTQGVNRITSVRRDVGQEIAQYWVGSKPSKRMGIAESIIKQAYQDYRALPNNTEVFSNVSYSELLKRAKLEEGLVSIGDRLLEDKYRSKYPNVAWNRMA